MPGWIDLIALVGLLVAGLAVIGAAAQRWGTDSRELGCTNREPWIGGR
ncbi:MAG: hypothetical protein ACHQZR_08320 [Candidatus Limnocylindrales bacterium]